MYYLLCFLYYIAARQKLSISLDEQFYTLLFQFLTIFPFFLPTSHFGYTIYIPPFLINVQLEFCLKLCMIVGSNSTKRSKRKTCFLVLLLPKLIEIENLELLLQLGSQYEEARSNRFSPFKSFFQIRFVLNCNVHGVH